LKIEKDLKRETSKLENARSRNQESFFCIAPKPWRELKRKQRWIQEQGPDRNYRGFDPDGGEKGESKRGKWSLTPAHRPHSLGEGEQAGGNSITTLSGRGGLRGAETRAAASGWRGGGKSASLLSVGQVLFWRYQKGGSAKKSDDHLEKTNRRRTICTNPAPQKAPGPNASRGGWGWV